MSPRRIRHSSKPLPDEGNYLGVIESLNMLSGGGSLLILSFVINFIDDEGQTHQARAVQMVSNWYANWMLDNEALFVDGTVDIQLKHVVFGTSRACQAIMKGAIR